MSNSMKRILVGSIMALIAIGAGVAEYFGFPAVRILSVLIVLMMIAEFITSVAKFEKSERSKPHNLIVFGTGLAWLLLMLVAAYYIGNRPWIILLMLLIISFADIGAWFFGRLIGGDKMWERLSAGKTWAGQISGIFCGTFAAIMYGLLGADTFMPQLMWIGIGVALLSQYGDLTASWFKRKMGIKDFGHILPGHGGIIDRFDGWIYVLPIIWLITL